MCALLLAAATIAPARQAAGTIVVSASEFFDQIPKGDTIGGGFNNTAWLFNNEAIQLGSAEDVLANISIPESGTYHLFVRSGGTQDSSFQVAIGGKLSLVVFGKGPLGIKSGGAFELRKGTAQIGLTSISPRAMFNVLVLSKNPNFQEKDLESLELPAEV